MLRRPPELTPAGLLGLARSETGRRLIRFGIVGLATAALYAAVVAAGLAWLSLPLAAAGALGYALAVPLNYLAHKRFTFRSDAAHGSALPRFCAVFCWGFTVNTVILHVARDLPTLGKLAAQAGAIVLMSGSTYAAMSLWVFLSRAPRLRPAEA